MPVKSEAQRRLMFAALRDPKGVGSPRSVAEKFVGPKAHAEGGEMKESKKMVEKEVSERAKDQSTQKKAGDTWRDSGQKQGEHGPWSELRTNSRGSIGMQ